MRKDRNQIIAQAIPALRNGVQTAAIARLHGIHQTTLARWLEKHPDAYQARCEYISNCLFAPDPKNTAFWRRTRLERLSLYREMNGLPKATRRKKPRPGSDTSPSVSAEQHAQIIGTNDPKRA